MRELIFSVNMLFPQTGLTLFSYELGHHREQEMMIRWKQFGNLKPKVYFFVF